MLDLCDLLCQSAWRAPGAGKSRVQLRSSRRGWWTPAAGTDPASKLCLFPGEKHWVKLQWASQGKCPQWSCRDLWRRGWEHWDTAMGSRGCFSVCRDEGWAPSQPHSAPAARVQHPFPSGNDDLEGQPWSQASLTSPGGSTGKVLGTQGLLT